MHRVARRYTLARPLLASRPALWHSLAVRPGQRLLLRPVAPSQTFHTHSPLRKRKQKHDDDEPRKDTKSDKSDSTSVEDLEKYIKQTQTNLKDNLAKLRPGGRFNPDVLDDLRVRLPKGGESYRLRDLAQSIPRGRTINIVVGEKEHVKPITTAIQAASLNLSPQIDPQNSQQINVQMPTVTAQTRESSLQEAKATTERAVNAVREVAGKYLKKLQARKKDNQILPDDFYRASEQREKIVSAANKELNDIFESQRKRIGS